MSSSPELKAEKKRKRKAPAEEEEEELEIDVNLPEPPSKKAKRKEKKSKTKTPKDEVAKSEETEAAVDDVHPARKAQVSVAPAVKKEETSKRSDYGIWIGNLSFKTNKDALRRFLLDRGGIDESSITRVHLPMNDRQQNKGFAYIDFSSEVVLNLALTLSENLVDGRKVLIKNAKSFEGRPEKTKADKDAAENGVVSQKPASKRVFVGNLGFDMTRDELAEHFAQAGQVEDVFLATFEDSGKCKGFGWVTFADTEASSNAVRGFIWKKSEGQPDEPSESEDDVKSEDEDEKGDAKKKSKTKRKAHKPRKWFINKVNGRLLRCEFAEDKETRYNKRFGKGAPGKSRSFTESDANAGADEDGGVSLEALAADAAAARDAPKKRDPKMKKLSKDERQDARRKQQEFKRDARNTAPGKALANAPRNVGAIVEGQGKKVTFD
ncbi:RNA-binding protein rnp24 [Pseudocercospora fuligena]|uniref:RNA-binding protein rnp24 n=1 Tax=Pseudocercospora fuligena TaxID=685502 RepID=A0A8H6RUN5_9PEZI|nr:RNA-binding protein rnp24 [Pseudocercospora fuligena]